MSAIEALVIAYTKRRQWTLDLPHLGVPGCTRGNADVSSFPKGEEREFSNKTSYPFALGVQVSTDSGMKLIPITTLMNPSQGHDIVKDLVSKCVHPLDIIVGEWIRDDEWILRTSVDHLWWTTREQKELDRLMGLPK